MPTSTGYSNLPPSCTRALPSRVARLVRLAALVSCVLPLAILLHVTHVHVRERMDAAGPALAEWSAERALARFEAAGAEVGKIGRRDALRRAGDASPDSLAAALERALDDATHVSGLVLLDRRGQLLALAGSEPEVAELRGALRPGSAVAVRLVGALDSSDRRDGVADGRVRVLDARGAALPLVGVAVLADGGTSRMALYGLVSRSRLSADLRGDLLDARARVALVDEQGRRIAASVASGAPGPAPLRALDRGWTVTWSRPLDGLGWSVVVELPMLAALRPLAPAIALLLLAPPLLALAFGGLARRRAARWSRPLWSLYDDVRQAARNPESGEPAIPRDAGEAESLGLAFNVALQRERERRGVAEERARALGEQNRAFQEQHENLSRLTVTDPLTQLANRRFFEEQLSREIKRLTRGSEGLSILVTDIDDFKQLNDAYGHAAGDVFLRQIARVLQENVRATDLVARYGGEEFVVVAPATNVDGAVVLAEKIRTAVAEASFIVDDTMRPRRATISIGVAEYRGSQTDLFNSADSALYEAKAAGKNCVVAARGEREPSR